MKEDSEIEWGNYDDLIDIVDSLDDHLPQKERASKCQDCKRSDIPVNKTTCPFEDEINGEIITIYVCEECYHDRCMDI